MKAYRDDVRAKAAAFGRDPDDVKVLFLVYPTLAETKQLAIEKHARLTNSPASLSVRCRAFPPSLTSIFPASI